MRVWMRDRKMLKVSLRRAFVIADNEALWEIIFGILRRYKKENMRIINARALIA